MSNLIAFVLGVLLLCLIVACIPTQEGYPKEKG